MAPAIPFAFARSWLLVSAAHPDRFGPAADSAADAVILDLEDGVIPAAKDAARAGVTEYLSGAGSAWVRINDTESKYWSEDLQALAGLAGLHGVMLAKTESAAQVEATAEALGANIPIIPLVESARGVEFAFDIASAGAVLRIAFGSGDFRRDTGAGADPQALAYPRGRLVVASRAAGIAGPIDGPTLSTDSSVLSADLAVDRTIGLTGKLSLRKTQCPDINRAFSPAQDDIGWASEVIETLGEDGANVRDGSDFPRLARARKIRELAEIFGISAST